ncbi:MAG: hypothetical protein JSV34_00950 [Candidatus Omnitrophota bacterium]|nr:MAG: hypothetical protein JSV34_00950 [Candidatus Omnitrophota bacterium]
MDNQRRLVRLEVKDFLEIRPLDEVVEVVKGETDNFTLMGICFTSQIEWKKGQLLFIDYFIPSELDSVKLKIAVVWSELIDSENGYFCGGEIVEVEEDKEEKFASYYFQRLKERFF